MLAVAALGLATVLWLAAGLVIAERAGKAIRSPAKDVMISHAAGAVGRGKGFAVHEALDQIGAVAGPLLVAAVLAASGGYRAAFGVFGDPGRGGDGSAGVAGCPGARPGPLRTRPAPHRCGDHRRCAAAGRVLGLPGLHGC